MENSCGGRESIRFDTVKILLLADAHPSFSYLQQIRDTSPFWSRHFQQRPSETGAFSSFRAERQQDIEMRRPLYPNLPL